MQKLDLLLDMECLNAPIPPPPNTHTLWLLENFKARSVLPWERDGCCVYFVHVEKISFDAVTPAVPSSYGSAVAGCFSPGLGVQ